MANTQIITLDDLKKYAAQTYPVEITPDVMVECRNLTHGEVNSIVRTWTDADGRFTDLQAVKDVTTLLAVVNPKLELTDLRDMVDNMSFTDTVFRVVGQNSGLLRKPSPEIPAEETGPETETPPVSPSDSVPNAPSDSAPVAVPPGNPVPGGSAS